MGLKQYQIVLVCLDSTISSEIRKTRQSVIISPDEMNNCLETIVIAPLTSQSKAYPTRVETIHNHKKGWIVLDQIRTVDKQRIVKILDKLTEKESKKVKAVIKEAFVD